MSGNERRKESYAKRAVDAAPHRLCIAHRSIDFGKGYPRSIETLCPAIVRRTPFEERYAELVFQ